MTAGPSVARLAWVALWLLGGVLLGRVLMPGSAHAYSAPEAYAELAYQGGGEGRWFTGSPADGFGCGVCHAPAAGQREYPLYVQGLPTERGYALAAQHQVVLSWPQFATRWSELRPDPALPLVPGAPLPGIGLTAELVAESGAGSGVIEIGGPGTTLGELCEQTRPNLKPRLAAKLYQVRANVAPLLVRPDANGVLRCESRLLGNRCIVALSSCGARELRLRWTAPAIAQGPIWFSGGLVATEAITGTFEQDAVSEVSLALVPQGTAGGDYQQSLQSGCATRAPRGHGSAGGAGACGVLLLIATSALVRRRARRVRERR